MSKFKFDLDEYDDDFDDVFNDSNDIDTADDNISEDVEYSKFNQIMDEDNNLDVEEVEYNDDETPKENIIYKSNDTNILSNIYKWFSRIGVFIAVVLIALFITNGDISSLVKYILLLVFSFGLGYCAMFLYDKYKEID